jgi:hypothetical protein
MIHDLAYDLRSRDRGLTDVEVVYALVQEDALEFQAATHLGVAVINLHHIPFTDSVLP